MASMSAVAATVTTSAIHFELSMRTNAAHAASAFTSDSSTILTTMPGAPEKAAIPRAMPLGLKTGPGASAAGAVAVLMGAEGSGAGVRGGRPPV